jgi:serine/threonine protein kinase
VEPSLSRCLDDDEMLSFVDGALGSERRREVLAHVDECETCQRLAAELARENDPALPSTSQLDHGEVISGRFVLDKPLGRGAMGTVYRARDQTLGIDVALKLLRRDDARADHRRAFRRELEVGRRITHRNVCRLYDAGCTDHYDYITMELIEGDTLAHVLAKEELPRARALEILAGIAAGLGAAHELGIVHRDLKPANVMIERATQRVVLTDFGFATDLDAKQSRRLVGTPTYWAPEQARAEPATPACDVYAFGVLAYRLLTGEEFSLSDRHALDRVPRDLRKVVAKCAAPRPSDRYVDATDAGAALAAAVKGRRSWPLLLLLAAVGLGLGLAWRFIHVAVTSPPIATESTTTPVAEAGRAAPSERPPASAETAASASASASASAGPPAIVSPLSGATSARSVHRPSMPSKPSVAVSGASPSASPAPGASEGDLLYRK